MIVLATTKRVVAFSVHNVATGGIVRGDSCCCLARRCLAMTTAPSTAFPSAAAAASDSSRREDRISDPPVRPRLRRHDLFLTASANRRCLHHRGVIRKEAPLLWPYCSLTTTANLQRGEARGTIGIRRNSISCWRGVIDQLSRRRWSSSRSSSSSSQQQCEEDATLQWARAHPEIAQACLNPPFVALHRSDSGDLFFESWDDYWDWRGWEFPIDSSSSSSSSSDQAGCLRHGQALATHVLTAPLTLFAAAPLLLPNNNAKSTEDLTLSAEQDQQQQQLAPLRTIRWCCLGARSEASLPIEYWNELLGLLDHQQKSNHYHHTTGGNTASFDLQLDFCGPEMDARRPDATLVHGTSKLTLRWVYAGKYHDYYDNELPRIKTKDTKFDHCYDAFVLFNPGLGHPHLQNDWRPTLDLLFKDASISRATGDWYDAAGRLRQQHSDGYDVIPEGKRCDDTATDAVNVVLLTAHSALDAARDAEFLRKRYNIDNLTYVENPFASRIRYQDPLQPDHVVRSNHYVAAVVVSSKPRG